MTELSALKAKTNTSKTGQTENQTRKALKQTLILGLGNEFMGDEGIGVHAVRQLRKANLPQSTKVVEVGAAILDGLLLLKHAERLIVLDAMKNGGTPGTVYKIPLG